MREKRREGERRGEGRKKDSDKNMITGTLGE